MALESFGYKLTAPFGELFLWIPELFSLGLQATQRGVEIEPVDIARSACVITVFRTPDSYDIHRPRTDFKAIYTDYVDCLNELLLQLVYEYMALLPKWELLHCSAAQSASGENTLAFGDKRAGKSVWAFRHTLEGGTLLADDLLAWNQTKSEFLCFGLSSRLRRPVEHTVFETLSPDDFLPGERLTYVKRTAINLAACGTVFLPDKIVEIASGTHLERPLSILKMLNRIRQSCIPRTAYC